MESKSLQAKNQLYFGLIAIVLGILFVLQYDKIVDALILIIGVASIVAGIVLFISFFVRTKGVANKWKQLPVTAPLALLLGILLVVNPALWKEVFYIILGIVLILIAILQFVSLNKINKSGTPVPWGYLVFPLLILVVGIVMFFNQNADWLVWVFGVCCIVYGISELFVYFALLSGGRGSKKATSTVSMKTPKKK